MTRLSTSKGLRTFTAALFLSLSSLLLSTSPGPALGSEASDCAAAPSVECLVDAAISAAGYKAAPLVLPSFAGYFLQQGRGEEAFELAQRSKSQSAFGDLGTAALEAGDLDLVWRTIEAGVPLTSSRSPDNRIWLSLRAAAGDPLDAVEWGREKSAEVKSMLFLADLVSLEATIGDVDRALDRTLAIKSPDSRAFVFLALFDALVEADESEKALNAARTFVEQAIVSGTGATSTKMWALVRLALRCLQMGRQDIAEDALNLAEGTFAAWPVDNSKIGQRIHAAEVFDMLGFDEAAQQQWILATAELIAGDGADEEIADPREASALGSLKPVAVKENFVPLQLEFLYQVLSKQTLAKEDPTFPAVLRTARHWIGGMEASEWKIKANITLAKIQSLAGLDERAANSLAAAEGFAALEEPETKKLITLAEIAEAYVLIGNSEGAARLIQELQGKIGPGHLDKRREALAKLYLEKGMSRQAEEWADKITYPARRYQSLCLLRDLESNKADLQRIDRKIAATIREPLLDSTLRYRDQALVRIAEVMYETGCGEIA